MRPADEQEPRPAGTGMSDPTNQPDRFPTPDEAPAAETGETSVPASPAEPGPIARSRSNGRRNGGLLAERVSKLEAAVGELQDTKITEAAVTERVISRLTAMAGEPRRIVTTPGVLLDGEDGDTLALASDPDPAPGTTLAMMSLPDPHPAGPTEPPLPLDPPEQPPSGAVIRPPAPPDPDSRGWFLPQLVSELRLTCKMYFDPRYRISRTAQVLMPFTVLLFVMNYFLFAVWLPIPLIGPILERLVGVLLAIFFYKVMIRELRRYREVLDYLSRYGPR